MNHKQYNIIDVANRLGLRVVRGKCLCPFHGDHNPSLSFKNNRFRCWACNASGDAIDLVKNIIHCSFSEALTWLEGSGINNAYRSSASWQPNAESVDLSQYAYIFDNPIITNRAAAFLFNQRRLDKNAISDLRISSTHEHIVIPYFDLDGKKLLSIQWRYLGYESSVARFSFARGCRPSIYNLPILNTLSPTDDLFIAEGCSDCWAMLSNGLKAIAIPSATLLKSCQSQHIDILRHHPRLHIIPDNDMPGEALYQQMKQQLPQLIKHSLPDGYKDYAEYYKTNDKRQTTKDKRQTTNDK